MTGSECIEYQGQIVFRDPWQTHFTKPLRYRLYWPTGVKATDYPSFINQPAVDWGDGLYKVNGRLVALEQRGQTIPIFTEEEPIKRPRWGKEYRDGQWHR